MRASTLRRMLRKGHAGTFRALKPGEMIEQLDIAVSDCWLEEVSETSVGKIVDDKDVIMRFAFQERIQ